MDNLEGAKKRESNRTSEAMRLPPEKPVCDERLREQADDAGRSEVFDSPVSQLSSTDWASVLGSAAVSNVRTGSRDNQTTTDAVEPRPSAGCTGSRDNQTTTDAVEPRPSAGSHHLGNTIDASAKDHVEAPRVSGLRRSIRQLTVKNRRSSSLENLLDTSAVSLHSPSYTESSVTSISAVTIPSFLAKVLPPTAEQTPAYMGIASPADPLSAERRDRRQPRLAAAAPDFSARELSVASTTPCKLTDLHSLTASAEESRSNVRAYIATMLVVLGFCALLVALLLIAVPSDGLRTVCTSSSCAALEALLADSVDQSREPCSNFYAYVCHGWGHSHNLSVYHSHVRRFLEEVEEVMIAWPEARSADRAVVSLYQACVSVLVGGAEELFAFRDQLQLCGVSWPGLSGDPDVVLTAARVYDNFRVAALLRIRTLSRRGVSDLLEVSPDEGFLLAWQRTRTQLLRDGVYERLFEETRNIYVGYSGLAEEFLPYDQFVKLESSIFANLVHEERHTYARNATFKGTVDSLTTVTKNIGSKAWRTTANKLGLSNSARVLVTNLDYLTAVDQLLRVVDEQRLHYYVGWCVVQQIRRYIDKAFASAWYEYEATSEAVSDSPERTAQAYCVQLVENLVGPLAFRRFALVYGDFDWTFVSSMETAIVAQLFKKVMGALGQDSGIHYFQPADLNTASSPARVGNASRHEDALMALDKALEKWEITNKSSLFGNWMYIAAAVSKVDASFGYLIRTAHVRNLLQNQWYDLLDDWSGTLSLQPLLATLPVYRSQLNDAAKYGTLGTLVATASLRGLLAKIAGDLPVNEEAARKLHCFAQSAQFQSNELELFHTAVSVDIAIDAFRSMRSTDRLRLHMFDELQTFFVLVCYLLCTPYASTNVEAAEASCNEAVKNSANFPAAFNCAPGSPMNPERKCSFF